MFNLTKPNIGL